jgi:hypothetical protein
VLRAGVDVVPTPPLLAEEDLVAAFSVAEFAAEFPEILTMNFVCS